MEDADLLTECVVHDSFVRTCVSCNPVGAAVQLAERIKHLTEALRSIEKTLGPASCACAGLQCEVDEALAIVREALA